MTLGKNHTSLDFEFSTLDQPIFLVSMGPNQNITPNKRSSDILTFMERSESSGLGSIRAYSAQRGLNVHLRQYQAESDLEEIIATKPIIVAFSVITANYDLSAIASRIIKKRLPKTKIIWGGHQALSLYHSILNKEPVDFVVLGEGEKPFYELAKALLHSDDLGEVQGLAYLDHNCLVSKPRYPRLTSSELDSIDYRLAHDFSFHSKIRIAHSVPFSEMIMANVNGSRGCTYNCSFCSGPLLWERKVVFRTPENIVSEVEFLLEKGINYIFFTDDDFLLNKSHSLEIAQLLKNKNISIKYGVMASVVSASRYTPEELKLLQESGCAEISVGMESGSLKVLEDIGKIYSRGTLLETTAKIYNSGINLGLYYILGFPEQTVREIEEDIDLIKTLPFSRVRPAFATPFPGTRLYDQVSANSLLINGQNWNSYNCEVPLIRTEIDPSSLIDLQRKILALHLTPEYTTRMRRNASLGDLGALEEYQNDLNQILK